jgi:hypothetical protein
MGCIISYGTMNETPSIKKHDTQSLTKDLECPHSFYFVRALRGQCRTHIQHVFKGEINLPILIPSWKEDIIQTIYKGVYLVKKNQHYDSIHFIRSNSILVKDFF